MNEWENFLCEFKSNVYDGNWVNASRLTFENGTIFFRDLKLSSLEIREIKNEKLNLLKSNTKVKECSFKINVVNRFISL